MEIKVGGVLFMKSFLIGVKRVFLPTFLVITVSLLNLSYTHTHSTHAGTKVIRTPTTS